MARYILRRILISIPILLGITFITYVIINAAPGDPVMMMIDLSQEYTEYDLELMRASLGLDKPLGVRYVLWLKELMRGNLGYSIVTSEPVLDRIKDRMPASLELIGAGFILSLCIGIPLGVLSAVKQYSWIDYVATSLTFAALCIPTFFLGLGAIYVFSLKLDLTPTAGMYTLGVPFSLGDHLRHLISPALVLAAGYSATILRYTRSSMLETLGQDYVRTARAKGLKERRVIYGHALVNGLIPVITIVGMTIARGLVAGAMITETIFQWPGMGMLGINAIPQRDYPVLMGVNLVIAIVVLAGNLITDIAYAVVDPRIRYD